MQIEKATNHYWIDMEEPIFLALMDFIGGDPGAATWQRSKKRSSSYEVAAVESKKFWDVGKQILKED
jgi:hypothetical protein